MGDDDKFLSFVENLAIHEQEVEKEMEKRDSEIKENRKIVKSVIEDMYIKK